MAPAARKRLLVTSGLVALSFTAFAWEWHAAPRIEATSAARRALPGLRGELYLGQTFEGLPLLRVEPFFYSDCPATTAPVVRCSWVQVEAGIVTGNDPEQVARARTRLRPVT